MLARLQQSCDRSMSGERVTDHQVSKPKLSHSQTSMLMLVRRELKNQ